MTAYAQQLVEAALKAAAAICEEWHSSQNAQTAVAIRSLDRAAIVASVPQPSMSEVEIDEQAEFARFEAWTATKRKGWGPISPRDAWISAKRDALTQAPQNHIVDANKMVEPQERVELTDAVAIPSEWLKPNAIVPVTAETVGILLRALLSANQGKKS